MALCQSRWFCGACPSTDGLTATVGKKPLTYHPFSPLPGERKEGEGSWGEGSCLDYEELVNTHSGNCQAATAPSAEAGVPFFIKHPRRSCQQARNHPPGALLERTTPQYPIPASRR